MMLPSESAERQKALLAQHPPEIQQQVGIITRKLLFLGCPAIFTRLCEGPVVRTFYFKPTDAFKFSAVFSKEEEFAGALSVESVRIERELGEVALSVPRTDRQVVTFDSCLHQMLTSTDTKQMALPLLMGQSIAGEYLYADLAAQPHLLIAGATNSGKSIYTAQLICSLALFRTPEELEFTLVDTKNLDLVLFKSLAHVKYVLSQVEDIRAALSQLMDEVRLRNEKMSGICRNIREWNSLGYGKPLQYKIIIVDELADVLASDAVILSQFPKKERPESIHSLIQRLAQLARAAGVHIITATQRPSVKILGGDAKANFPARVCFKLPSQADSRVVLDENGAENLLGAGDYLYKIAGSDIVKRAHSAFVSTNTIASIISQNDMIRRQYAQILQTQSND